VRSRHPLWDAHDEEHDPEGSRVLDEGRFDRTTSFVEAEFRALARMPQDTMTPLLTALGLFALFAGVVIASKAVLFAGLVAAVAGVFAWLWPEPGLLPPPPPGDPIEQGAGTLGMWLFICTEAMLFVLLFFAYFWLGPYPNEKPPELKLPLIMLAILVSSSVLVHFGARGEEKGHQGRARLAAAVAAALGLVFLGLQLSEYGHKLQVLTPQMSAYGSIFYTLTGIHGLHVLTGVVMLGYAAGLPRMPDRSPHRSIGNASRYWHFVDVVWVAIVLVVYVAPHWVKP
jgi:heme/copper-type cytochrome/quinol oxidase subunit 3